LQINQWAGAFLLQRLYRRFRTCLTLKMDVCMLDWLNA